MRTARVLVRREQATDGTPWYVAQVLEFDLAAQAETIDDLTYEIQRMIVAHIVCCEQEKIRPFGIPKAPQEYFDEYASAKSTFKLDVDITRFQVDAPLSQTPPELAFAFGM